MLGIPGNCSKPLVLPCFTPCEHSTLVRGLYGQEAGGQFPFNLLIDAFLSQQEDFLRRVCGAAPDLLGLAELAGWKRCCPALIDRGCITVCGSQVRQYQIDDCKPCSDLIVDDEFCRSVIAANRMAIAPTGDVLRRMADSFGWSITYQPESIYLHADNPAMAASVLHLFPIPIGESLTIVSIC